MSDLEFQFHKIVLGLPKLAQAEQGGPLTCDDMRREIERGSRDSHIIRQCLESARYLGMSGEDTYVQLAYHALLELERVHKELCKCINLTSIVRSIDAKRGL